MDLNGIGDGKIWRDFHAKARNTDCRTCLSCLHNCWKLYITYLSLPVPLFHRLLCQPAVAVGRMGFKTGGEHCWITSCHPHLLRKATEIIRWGNINNHHLHLGNWTSQLWKTVRSLKFTVPSQKKSPAQSVQELEGIKSEIKKKTSPHKYGKESLSKQLKVSPLPLASLACTAILYICDPEISLHC